MKRRALLILDSRVRGNDGEGAFGLYVGLLINFGATKLEFRRVVKSLNRGLC